MRKLVAISLALSGMLFAKDFVVCHNGCPYNSIQAAINDLNNSAGEYNITIKPGVYDEHIEIEKSVNLIGDGDPKEIILTGDDQHRIIDISTNGNGHYDKVSISNLTIKNGKNSAVRVYSATIDNIEFKNVIFEGNKNNVSGGAVYVGAGVPTFEKCEFDNNIAKYGGAIYIYIIMV